MHIQQSFIERLWTAVSTKKSRVVVGLDPVIEKMPHSLVDPIFKVKGDSLESRVDAIWQFNEKLIEGLSHVAVAFKVQIAFYEAYGVQGLEVYSKTLKKIRLHDVIAIGDVKRGDIGSTAAAYASAHLGGHSNNDFEADAITVNPLFGSDGVEPFISLAIKNRKGLFLLVKTSNPSAVELQDVQVKRENSETWIPLYQRIASLVNQWGRNNMDNGYSNIGAVVGATFPEQLTELRKLLPHTPFLIPGYGAQGATADDVVNGFNQDGLGAIVNSSRGIIFAGKDADDFVSEAVKSAEKMRDEIEEALKRRNIRTD